MTTLRTLPSTGPISSNTFFRPIAPTVPGPKQPHESTFWALHEKANLHALLTEHFFKLGVAVPDKNATDFEELNAKAKQAIDQFHTLFMYNEREAPGKTGREKLEIAKEFNQTSVLPMLKDLKRRLKNIPCLESKFVIKINKPTINKPEPDTPENTVIELTHKSTGSVAIFRFFCGSTGDAFQPILHFQGADSVDQHWDVMKELLGVSYTDTLEAASELTKHVKALLEEEGEHSFNTRVCLEKEIKELRLMGQSFGGAKAQYAAARNGITNCVCFNSLELGSLTRGIVERSVDAKNLEIIHFTQKGDFARKFWLVRFFAWIGKVCFGGNSGRLGYELKFEEGHHGGEEIRLKNVRSRKSVPVTADPSAKNLCPQNWKEWRNGRKCDLTIRTMPVLAPEPVAIN
jgi:hypothetical protein